MFRIKTLIGFALISSTLLLSCSPEEKRAEKKTIENHSHSQQNHSKKDVTEYYLKQGRQSTKVLLTELQTALKGALKSGGTQAAIRVCNTSALPLTEAVAKKQQIAIKRVSFKPRNPFNQPDDFESRLLKQFETLQINGELNSDTELYEMVEKNGQKIFRYMKPLTVKTVCLQCHGTNDTMKSETLDLINQYYSKDKAIGYKEGDLRGAVSVMIKVNSQSG